VDIIKIILNNCSQFSSKPVLFDDLQYNYKLLGDNSRKLAGALQRMGVQPGDRIAVQLPKCVEFIYLFLAGLQIGSIMVPLNNTYTLDEIKYFLSDSGCKLFVCDQEMKNIFSHISVSSSTLDHCLSLSELSALCSGEDNCCDSEHHAEDPCLIIYTSGTTGKSKGAVLTRNNLLSNYLSLKEAWQYHPDDILLHCLPLFHVHGLLVAFLGAAATGMGMVIRTKFDAEDVLRCINTYHCTIFMGVPTMYQRLLQVAHRSQFRTSSIRLWISGSAPLTASTFIEFTKAFDSTILERYGMSETGMNISNPLWGERKPGSIGLPLPGIAVRIVDDQSLDVSHGSVGQLLIKGANVFQGYWRQPEKTAESFVDGWFKTGDLGYQDEAGYFYLVSRAKDLIISGGLNVYPKEVEDTIEQLDTIAEAAVIGIPDQDLGEQVVAVVVPRNNKTLTSASVISYCRNKLAPYKCPKQVHIVSELPKNTMGKIMKNQLRESYRMPT